MTSTKHIWLYIATLFFVSWGFQLLALTILGDINNEKMVFWLAFLMFTPLFVSSVFLWKIKAFREKLLWKPKKGVFIASFLAVLIPILIAFTVLLLLQYYKYGKSDWFIFSNNHVNISGGPFFLGKGNQSYLFFIFNVFITGAAFAVLNSIFAAGEEFAWRGLLQPLLTEQYGILRGIALLGFIWAMWHLPVLLSGYNYPDNPILGALVLFPIRMMAMSFFYAWLTLKSKSFIPAAFAHGALNGIQTGIVSNIKLNSPQIFENIATMGIEVVVGVIFLLLILRYQRLTKTA